MAYFRVRYTVQIIEGRSQCLARLKIELPPIHDSASTNVSMLRCRFRLTSPNRLHEAMRYAVLNGGKRVRPLLVYAAGECFGVAAQLC